MPSRSRAVRSGTTDKRFEALLLASASIVWWTDRTGQLVEEQPYWQEYTGQTWEEYRGSGWIAAIHPDDRDAILADWNKAVTTGAPHFTQGRVWSARHKSYRAFQTHGLPIRNDAGQITEWLGALTDIQDSMDLKSTLARTENDLASSLQVLRMTEAQHRESEDRFSTMANSAPVLLWMAGLDKRCTFFNQSWLDFTGRSMAQEVGNGWIEGVHPDDKARCFEVYSSAFDARTRFEMEYRLRRHDGEYRWVLDIGVPRYSHEVFCGYIGSAVDITERRQAEENNRRFEQLHRLALVGELSAAIAHELRQPLTAIKMNAKHADRLLSLPNPSFDELHEIATDIGEDASRADDVIDRIRNFLRRRSRSEEVMDLRAVVGDVIRLVSHEAQAQSIDIACALSDSVCRVRGDPTQIMQVLLNLFLNGMDSMKNSAMANRRLTVQIKRRGGLIEASVSDCGPGISENAMPHLFESFFSTRPEGMGMGLSIAKSIIDMHQGRIWAENIAGGGATFHFTLPAAP